MLSILGLLYVIEGQASPYLLERCSFPSFLQRLSSRQAACFEDVAAVCHCL